MKDLGRYPDDPEAIAALAKALLHVWHVRGTPRRDHDLETVPLGNLTGSDLLMEPREALGDEDVAVQLAAQGAMSKVADIGDERTVPA